MHLPPIPRFLVRWTIRGILVLLFVGVPAAMLYLRDVGLGFGLKERVAEALSRQGFQTQIGRLSLDPFQGLIAEEATLRGPQGAQLTRVARIVVSPNLAELVAGRLSIDHLELDETDVSIPVGDPAAGVRLNMTGVSAQLLFVAEQLRISFFEGSVQGIRVSIAGSLRNPTALRFQNRPSQTDPHPHSQTLANILETLSKIRYPSGPPELRATVRGDLADPASIEVSPVTLRSGPIAGPNWRVEGLEADASFQNGTLTLGRFAITGRGGLATLSGRWTDGVLDFDLSSSLSPEPFLGLIPKDSVLRKFKFLSPPEFEASGQIVTSASPVRYNFTGSLKAEKFQFREVVFSRATADFACRDGSFFIRDARLTAGRGKLDADALLAPGDFRLRLTNTVSPTDVAVLAGKKERETLDAMEFRDPPYLQLELRGPKPDFAAITGTGLLRLGRTSMRGSWLDWGESKIEIANRAITYRNFSLGRGKLTGSGTVVYDIAGQQVILDDVQSTMSPVDVMMWIDPKIAEVLKPYRFNQTPKVSAEGRVHMKDPRRNDLHLDVLADAGLDYDLLNRTLPFGRTVAKVGIVGTQVQANIEHAELMGGDVGIQARVSIDPADKTFGATVDVRRVNFADLTKLYFKYEDSLGAASGRFSFKATMGEEDWMKGDGNLRVEEGHVFAIPILGPLSDIINKIIPGAGFQTARVATADFTVEDRKISTKNLVIEGAGFSLYGNGDIHFATDKMDMSVRINARGIPGIVLFPVSKLFEYVSTGTFSKPEWRPKILPRFRDGE